MAPAWALARLAHDDALFGLAGERLVERHLRRSGWRLLARRLRTRFGELDLVFDAAGTRVVVEVKTGASGARFQPGMRMGSAALARRWHAARALARGAAHRVDLLEVHVARGRARIVHHQGVRRAP